MTLAKARKILKTVGIITIIGSAITILISIMIVVGLDDLVASEMEIQTEAQYQELEAFFVVSAVALIAAGICSLVEGVFSILASRNNRYGKICWLFSIVSIVTTIYQFISNLFKGRYEWYNPVSMLIALALNVLALYAAKTVKSAYEEETRQA